MLDNEPCEVNRSMAGPQGWSLLSFTPIRPALRTHALALLATACGALVTLGVASSMRLRAAHAAVHQHEQMLSRSLKEMERLMSVLSHDLRAPLAAAHYSAEYLLQSPQFRGEAREVLEMIAEQQMRMAEMVSRLLDAIRIRNGAMEWSWGNVAVQEVLLSAHRTVASLPTRSPEVQVELDAREAPSAIYGDAQAIIRLVTNLATNAIRHTTQGSVRIGVRLQQSGGVQWLVIEMADTGGGIAPEVLPLLGRPFVLGGTQGGSGGVGLGLAIAAGICAAHGGKLTVRSEVGGGTTFTAWLRADLPGPVRDGGEPTIQVERAAR
jgi:signal transduction histidine kinase